jgi:hypothetical protein
MDRAGQRSRRATFFVAMALAAIAPLPAHAIETSELTGWWIAIDDTLPKLSKLGAIATMEEVVQIDADGRVQDRAMNFSGGGAQACLDTKICSDLPAIASARLDLSGNHLTFTHIVASNALLDTVAGSLLVRQEAVTATPEWTATLENDRLTLRAVGASKTRTLARIEPDRLRKLYAGMRVSGAEPKESWRCYLRTATGGDPAFVTLRGRRTYRPPEFLDRYLTLASYIAALRSAVAVPSRDTTDEEQKKLLSVSAEALMVLPFDNVPRQPTADDRKRLDAVLTYIDRHTRTLIAFDTASGAATEAKARAAATAKEAANREALAKSTAAAADEAEAKVTELSPDYERVQAAAAAQARVVNDARATGQETETLAGLRQRTSDAAAAAADTMRKLALIQHKASRMARSYAADQQQRLEAALRGVTEQQQKAEQAKADVKAQQEKADAAAASAAAQQKKADEARLAAEKLRRTADGARTATAAQQQKIDVLTATVRAFDEVATAAQKAVDDAGPLQQQAAQPQRAPVLSEAGAPQAGNAQQPAVEAPQPSALDAATRDAATTASALQDALKSANAARDRAAAEVQAATARMAALTRTAETAEKQVAEATQAADAAQTAADQAQAAAADVAREAHRVAVTAQDAEARIAAASDITKGTEAARNASENEAQAEAQQATTLSASADAVAKTAHDMLAAAQTAVAARGKAVGVLNEIGAEAARHAAAARSSAETMNAARKAASAARAAAQAASAQSDAATQASTKAAAEAQAAIEAETAASEALKAAAASQPKDDPTTAAITDADIAALARVVGDRDDAQQLFCHGRYASRAAVPVAAPPAPSRANVAKPQPPAAAPAAAAVVPIAKPPTPRRAPPHEEAAAEVKSKPAKDVKPRKVSRPARETKSNKETKATKETKETAKESKAKKEAKSAKDSKPAKDSKSAKESKSSAHSKKRK